MVEGYFTILTASPLLSQLAPRELRRALPRFSGDPAKARIVWISAGDERVGFETSKTEDADLMYQAICILVDRCHA